jgi:hypothetical protein
VILALNIIVFYNLPPASISSRYFRAVQGATLLYVVLLAFARTYMVNPAFCPANIFHIPSHTVRVLRKVVAGHFLSRRMAAERWARSAAATAQRYPRERTRRLRAAQSRSKTRGARRRGAVRGVGISRLAPERRPRGSLRHGGSLRDAAEGRRRAVLTRV